MVWFNCITAFRTILDDTASDANGGVSLILVPSNVALKLTNARAASTARIAPALRVRSLTPALGSVLAETGKVRVGIMTTTYSLLVRNSVLREFNLVRIYGGVVVVAPLLRMIRFSST
jgi:hypothetical protein